MAGTKNEHGRESGREGREKLTDLVSPEHDRKPDESSGDDSPRKRLGSGAGVEQGRGRRRRE